MKKIALSPFVYKIKGAKNFLLHDLYHKQLFHLIPDRDVDQLINQLITNKLAIETNGVVPFKYKLDFEEMKYTIELHELEVRITGLCSEECSNYGDSCACFKDKKQKMSKNVFTSILEQFKNIPVNNLTITVGNPFIEKVRLRKILDVIGAKNNYIVFNNNSYHPSIFDGYQVITKERKNATISESSMIGDDFSFFMNHVFHSCWGKKIRIDVNGDIKLCFKHRFSFGNILNDNVKKLIINKKFDPFWELTKDKIEVCKDCEYRYACSDCRVMALEQSGSLYAKPPNCKYDPYKGIWSEK